mmetsp:Transcript_6789/g.26228  ORF Transcript_6789/g.26228 Transcript_6789/m.26228 type:complete len:84 (-) Transcript_6789:159-410(-)
MASVKVRDLLPHFGLQAFKRRRRDVEGEVGAAQARPDGLVTEIVQGLCLLISVSRSKKNGELRNSRGTQKVVAADYLDGVGEI